LSSSFARWPLKVIFFAEDVHKMWTRWLAQHPERNGLKEGIEVVMDETMCKSYSAEQGNGAARGIAALDVAYSALKPRLQQSQALIAAAPALQCSICHEAIPPSGAGMLVCPEVACSVTTHMTCLATHFLVEDEPNAIVPTRGHCPACNNQTTWSYLVKELSLRMRGENEIAALFKPRRTRKLKGRDSADDALVASEEENEAGLSENERPVAMDADEDVWQRLPDTSDVETDEDLVEGEPNPLHGGEKSYYAMAGAPRPEPVIEDSDWDDVEILSSDPPRPI
jgi:structure-specific endonuclease subunit SLX1